ncbi:NAD(P)H-hydrate dehydratase [Salinisphaera sp. LB1]|uniref:NAD(P)H-hydrate dehydratase n=1 Tax=Salinisphaera sp. LB1 TaxID=2183911 RepID=UPI000D706164|nr:NAD(P)H-hydrate dehydratase [Salinisphaera sp. LB1]AWN16917.1 NAD(P)HX epimerase [Salinisphaera sp. LB1]
MTETSDYLPNLVYDADQLRALDTRFINEFGVDGFALMERAARAAYNELAQNWPMPGRLVVFCGPGNNGGDGALVACQAMAAGWRVTLVAPLDLAKARGDAARAFETYREAGGEIRDFVDEPIQADLMVDALFGTGLNREVTGPMAQAIDRINEASGRGVGVLAIDIASGVDAGTGRTWGRAVVADTTVTFIGLKLGLLTGDGAAHCGELAFDDLGAPDALYEGQPHVARRITHRDLRHVLPARPRGAHKGDNGHVLCVGGGRGMGGAIRMSAESALRAGAGLVSVACHHDHAGAMSQARPELMCQGLPDDPGTADAVSRLDALIAAASLIAIGPGLGRGDWGDALWRRALDSDRPLVVDADALNRLAAAPVEREHWILTPHPGEAARLLGWSTADVVADRVQAARRLAERYRAVVALKGAGTLIATPDELWLCTQGNPGMAVGGMGDLLTGVIAGFAAQGMTLAEAAVFGVYVHALAGDEAAVGDGERGLLPTDLLPCIRRQANPQRP